MKNITKKTQKKLLIHLGIFLILGMLVYLYRVHITAIMLYWILKDLII
jgi:hypothetical protein